MQGSDTAPSSEAKPPDTAPQLASSLPMLAPLAAFVRNDLKWLFPCTGGLMMLVHFWQIGFLPSLSFADLGTVLGAFILYVLFGLLLFVFLLGLPSLVLALWIEASLFAPPPKPRQQNPGSRRSGLTSYWRRSPQALPTKAAKVIFSRQLQPGAFVWFLAAAVLSLALYVLLLWLGTQFPTFDVTTTVIGIFGVSAGTVLVVTIIADLASVRKKLRGWRKRWPQFALTLVLYLCCWPAVILPFISLGGLDMLSSRAKVLTVPVIVLLLLFVPFLHWLWYAMQRVPSRKSIPPRLIAVLLPLLYSGTPLLLVDATAETFGFGMMRRVDLVLTARGCEIAHAALPKQRCVPDPRGKAEFYRLERVDVLTRIGSQYYLAPDGGIADKRLPRFTLPASEVVSLIRPEAGAGTSSLKP